MAKNPQNALLRSQRIVAATFFASEHNISLDDTWENPTFKRMWADYKKHPYNPTIRKSLGLTRRRLRLEGEEEASAYEYLRSGESPKIKKGK